MTAPDKRSPSVPGRVIWWLVIPSIFDLAGTNLAQIGLLYTTVSYFQLLRCTVIVVTAFLKVGGERAWLEVGARRLVEGKGGG